VKTGKNRNRKIENHKNDDGGPVSVASVHDEIASKKDKIPAARTRGYNDAESPLSWLHKRRDKDGNPLVSLEEFHAGEQIRRDFTHAGLLRELCSNWCVNVRVSGGKAPRDVSDTVLAIRWKINSALKAVGPELSGVLVDVCCFLKGLEQVEMERKWPSRSAKVVLRLALARLARHYKLGGAAAPENRRKRSLHWGAEGYRPESLLPTDEGGQHQ